MGIVTKVLKAKRIPIPRDLCSKYNIWPGDIVIIEDLGDGLKIIPAKVVKRDISAD